MLKRSQLDYTDVYTRNTPSVRHLLLPQEAILSTHAGIAVLASFCFSSIFPGGNSIYFLTKISGVQDITCN